MTNLWLIPTLIILGAFIAISIGIVWVLIGIEKLIRRDK